MGKILAGQEQLTGGELRPGHNVITGYYAQHQAEALDPKMTVLETVEAVTRAQLFHQGSSSTAPRSQAQLRTLLGAFLFQGDDVYKPVKVLSGGEKSRLALAKMLLEPSNTLILDEPTNHLDMQSKEVVKEALLQFDGTVIIVSHDRDFLEDLADRVITFQDGHVKEYMKPLEEYLIELHTSELARISGKKSEAKIAKAEQRAIQRDQEQRMEQQQKQQRTESGPPAGKDDSKERKRVEAEERNARYKREKPLRNKIEKAEREIEEFEKEKQRIEDAMYDPDYYGDAERVKRDAERLGWLRNKLEELFFNWSAMNEELEK
jgi:ATP-binding cassette subfamily F protein 3